MNLLVSDVYQNNYYNPNEIKKAEINVDQKVIVIITSLLIHSTMNANIIRFNKHDLSNKFLP